MQVIIYFLVQFLKYTPFKKIVSEAQQRLQIIEISTFYLKWKIQQMLQKNQL